MPEEYLDIVDENNRPTGEKRLRSEVHDTGLWHRTVHIYLFRKSGEGPDFLVHLRAKTKDLNPNQWDTRFGGHLKSGEKVENAVVSELKDEIGLQTEPSRLLQGETYKRDKFPNREFTLVYYYEFDGDTSELKFNDGEVQEVKWMSTQDIVNSMQQEPDKWAGSLKGFREIYDFLINAI